MSDPSLLEYPLTSRCPLLDRFPGINSRVPHGTQSSVWFSQSFDLLSCLERVRYRFAVLFSRQSCGTVPAIFVGHVLAAFQPEATQS
jgi:hypothetical protein